MSPLNIVFITAVLSIQIMQTITQPKTYRYGLRTLPQSELQKTPPPLPPTRSRSLPSARKSWTYVIRMQTTTPKSQSSKSQSPKSQSSKSQLKIFNPSNSRPSSTSKLPTNSLNLFSLPLKLISSLLIPLMPHTTKHNISSGFTSPLVNIQLPITFSMGHSAKSIPCNTNNPSNPCCNYESCNTNNSCSTCKEPPPSSTPTPPITSSTNPPIDKTFTGFWIWFCNTFVFIDNYDTLFNITKTKICPPTIAVTTTPVSTEISPTTTSTKPDCPITTTSPPLVPTDDSQECIIDRKYILTCILSPTHKVCKPCSPKIYKTSPIPHCTSSIHCIPDIYPHLPTTLANPNDFVNNMENDNILNMLNQLSLQ